MSGEMDLKVLLSLVTAKLDDGLYVFVTLRDQPEPKGLTPRMRLEEPQGTTLILTQAEADAAGLDYEYPCRMITLDVHSALEAVGFIARITKELADGGISMNVIAGFYHDHLFVPDGREGDAVRILEELPYKV